MSGDGSDQAGREAPRSEDPDDRFDSAVHQFYRAEMERMVTWRTRLDQTTNWTVVVIAAVLTWSFSSPDNPHYVLLVGALATVGFLLIEAQRYQEYDAWRARVRVLQREFFADVYAPGDRNGDPNWRENMGRDLRTPSIRIPYLEAVSHRLGHVYLPMLTILLAAWVARITVFVKKPVTAAAAIEAVPGVAVLGVVGVVYLAAAGLAGWSLTRAPRREFDAEVDAIRSGEDA